ncbi:MAG TPA: VOC family protein [Ignavibacteriaceae bacterium]|nr:VOC family protein [Ignavibacteriaceae bacterium]
MQKIIPFLWFDNNAEEAAKFYTSLFKNSKTGKVVRYTEASAKASGMPEGSAMTVPFEIEGYKFTAINGGPVFKFTPAISFFVNSESKDEIQKLWDKLSQDGKALMPLDKYPFSEKYGWVQDKYGLSWQLFYSENKVEYKIVPSLMFVGNLVGKAEEAINYYLSIFKDAKRITTFRYGAGREPDKEESIAYADFLIEGQCFAIMESAREHKFNFNEAVSFVVNCKDQKEIDYYWDKLTEGGDEKAQMCGWLKDKYGVSWQVVPENLAELMSTPEKSQRVMQAVLKMKKIDLEELKTAQSVEV